MLSYNGYVDTFMWFHKLQLVNNADDENLVCRFTYIRNDKSYQFDFPLSVGLREPDNSAVEKTYDLPINKRSYDYDELFFAAIYHPFTMFAAGVASAVNVLYTVAAINNTVPVFASVFGAMSLTTNVAVLGLSLAYFVPVIAYKLVKNRLRAGLLHTLNDALNDVCNNKLEEAYNKLNNLPFVYKIMLYPYFQGNTDLKWSFNYVQSLRCYNNNMLQMAIRLSETPDQLFLILKIIISKYNLRRKNMLDTAIGSISLSEHDKREKIYAKNAKGYAANIKQYTEIIPVTSMQHKELELKLRASLMSSVDSLKNCCVAEACKKFDAIEWDGYCKAAYPAVAILYYQLRAVLTIASQGLNVKFGEDLFVLRRLVLARQALLKVKGIVDEFYPHKSKEYQKYINEFDAFDSDIENAYVDTEVAKPPITPFAALCSNREIVPYSNSSCRDDKILRVVNTTYWHHRKIW